MIIFLDTNVMQDNSEAMKTILELENNGKVDIRIPHTVYDEIIKAGEKSPEHLKKFIYGRVMTKKVDLNEEEKKRKQDFMKDARGNTKNGSMDADFEHLWEAKKYGCTLFLTRDTRISSIKRLAAINQHITGLKIVTPEECVNLISKSLEQPKNSFTGKHVPELFGSETIDSLKKEYKITDDPGHKKLALCLLKKYA